MSSRRRSRNLRRAKLIAGGLLIVAFLGLLAWALAPWWFGADLERARQLIEARRYSEAREKLVRVLAWCPGWDEAEYLLGVSEGQLQHPEAAIRAWTRVSRKSPYADQAALNSTEAAIASGHFATAEIVLLDALHEPGPQEVQLRQELIQLLWREARFDEVRQLMETNWQALRRQGRVDSPLAISTLRGHLSLDLETYTVQPVTALLEKTTKQTPEDDRAWLGLANLAIRSGRYEHAARMLDRCLRRRPGDGAVWRSRLDLALATGQSESAFEAIDHLTSEQVPPARMYQIQAWFAARLQDDEAERDFLEKALREDPGQTTVLDRLAELATEAKDSEHAAELRQRKAKLDEAKNAYANLLSSDFVAQAPVLADLAERLGRRFEARAFWVLHQRRHPDDPRAREALARLGQPAAERPAPKPIAGHFETLRKRRDEMRSDASRLTRSGSLPHFQEAHQTAGIDFRFDSGKSTLHQLPETMSGGLALLDYDGDGWLDVYLVQGGHFPPDDDHASPGDRLFRNQGDGSFVDVSKRTGISDLPPGYGHGVAVGDYDNDGHPDVFLTRWRSYRLLHNRGGGHFDDVTDQAGLGGDRDWPTSAAWADFDGDGDLDLYVCHYLVWDPKNPRLCRNGLTKEYSYCAPRLFESIPDHLFRNDGGRFVDVTAEAGIVDHDGRGLGVLAADLDDDGRVDIFVANDGSANFLFQNRGGLSFEETGHAAGVAANAEGGYQAGMGIACADLDGDSRLDLAVTNFYGESTSFFQNLGDGIFADRTEAVGLAAPTRYLLGFGVAMADFDNDGRLDLLAANGHVNDLGTLFPYRMPAQLLIGSDEGRLNDVSQQAGSAITDLRVGRGLAIGDVDNDGWLDGLILAQNWPVAYLHNDTEHIGHFLTLQLEGSPSNRDGVGARVILRAGRVTRVAQRMGGGSYLSAGDPRLHFGLGRTRTVDSVEVRWPSGKVSYYAGLQVDAGYVLREGQDKARPLASFRKKPATR